MLMRNAVLADITGMLALEAAAATAAHWTKDMYARIFSPEALPRLALVLEEDGNVKGFMVALCAGPEWELENLVIAQNERRQGWGGRLVRELISQAQAKKAEAVFLEVRESNAAARELYRRGGFVESGRKRDYYQDPAEDAVVLSFFLERAHADGVTR